MNRYDRQNAIAQQYFDVHILENSPGTVKSIIRNMKLTFLDHYILDNAYHNRYWVIKFNEEWVDAVREWTTGTSGYPINPHEGDKIFRLYGSITEARTEHFVIPEIDTTTLWEIPNRKHAKTVYHKAKNKFWKWANRRVI